MTWPFPPADFKHRPPTPVPFNPDNFEDAPL